SATPRLRIGTVGIVAFGSQTVLANSPSFFGLTRLSEELQASAATASVGPNDLVGSNFYGGVEGPLIETSYTLRENLADSSSGTTNVMALGGSAYPVSMMVPAAVIGRNRATSSKLLIGWQVSSLTPVALDAVAEVHGRHLVFFDGESEVTGNNIAVTLANVQETFNGSPPNYGLLPNNGGTAALYDDAARAQPALGCAGCAMSRAVGAQSLLAGGGVGERTAPGPRVSPPEPCLVTDPIDPTTATGRCAVGINKRGSFHADRLTIEGSM